MIVVDTNVICYLFLPGPFTKFAQAALRKDSHWCSPALWRSEFRSVLALYLRQNAITPQDAKKQMQAAEDLFWGRELTVRSGVVFDLVAQSARSAL